MLIRCVHCFTPFTLTPETIQVALDQIEDNGWKHYNAFCPRCGKPNVVGKDQLLRFAPDWAAENAPKPISTPPAAAPKPASTASRPARPAKASAKPKAAARPKASAAKKAKPKKAAPAKKKPAAKTAAKPKAKSGAKKKKKK